MKKIGLYFGTFNPIHVGHLIIANHMVEYTDMDEVWLVVSPQNPLKERNSLLADYHRLALTKIGVDDNPKLRVSDVEFKLTKPSYTAHTLAYLGEQYPDVQFSLIMGEDNLRSLHKWKNYEHILDTHKVYVYPRVLTEQEKADLKIHRTKASMGAHPGVIRIDAPVMKVSASFIRRSIAEGRDVRYLLTEPVYKYLREMHFYETGKNQS
jgi:nicotinate-nucleotide adenylyltransferase